MTIKRKSGIIYKIDKTTGKIKVKKNKKLKIENKGKKNPFESKKKKSKEISDKNDFKKIENEKVIIDLKNFDNEVSKKISDIKKKNKLEKNTNVTLPVQNKSTKTTPSAIKNNFVKEKPDPFENDGEAPKVS